MNSISFNGFLKREEFQADDLDYLLENDELVSEILPLKILNAFEIRKLEWPDFVGTPDPELCWIAHCYWNITYSFQRIEEKEQMRQSRESSRDRYSNKERAVSRSKEYEQRAISKSKEQEQQPKQALPPLPRINSRLPPSYANCQQRAVSRNSSPQNSNKGSRNQSPIEQKIVRSTSSTALKRSSSQQPYRYQITVFTKFLEKSWAKSKTDSLLLEHETGHYLLGCLCALEFKRQAESKIFDSELHIKTLFQDTLKYFLQIEKNYDYETDHFVNTQLQKQWNRKLKEQLLLYEIYFQQCPQK